MKRILLLSLLPSLFLTACNTPREQEQDRVQYGRFGHQQQTVQEDRAVLEETATATRTETESSVPTQSTVESRPAPEPVIRRADLPAGIPIPGKSGQVYSPYKPNSGIVDISGYPPGMEVRCPYTGKIFLVP